jgi:hypothetical protein
MFYVTVFWDVVISRRSQRRIVGWVINDEVEGIWKERVVIEVLSQHLMEGIQDI